MAFPYRERRGGSVYVYELESYRDGKKVKHRKKYKGVEKDTPDGPVFIPANKDLLERIILADNVHLGDVAALHALAKELGLATVIDEQSIKGGGIASGVQLVLMAINHAISPRSLRGFASWYEDTALPTLSGIPPERLNPDNLSSAMDGVCREVRDGDEGEVRVVDRTGDICRALVDVWSALFDIETDALYYDITSTYFEGVKCILAKLGYSRDKKEGKVQINIALIVTRRWSFPLYFVVYTGDTQDQATVRDVLRTLRSEFGIRNCTIIWDRGMVSGANVRRVDRAKQKMVCGLKGHEREVREVVLSVPDEELVRSENLVRHHEDGEDIYAVAIDRELYGKRRRVVVYLNTQMQRQVRERRERKLRSARIKLGLYRKKLDEGKYQKHGPVVSHARGCLKGVSKYFKMTYNTGPDGKITIGWKERTDRIEVAERMDGKFALMSSDLTLDCRGIVDAYFGKAEIERTFRCMKQVVELHPTRHWLENRVKVHVFVCYLAFLLLRSLEFKLYTKGMKMSAQAALEELGKIKQGVLIDPTTDYRVIKVARLTNRQEMLIKALGLSGYICSET